MHNFEHKGTSFNYNSDMSGNVYIDVRTYRGFDKPEETPLCEVPAEALLAFVAYYLGHKLVETIEDATPEQILALFDRRKQGCGHDASDCYVCVNEEDTSK